MHDTCSSRWAEWARLWILILLVPAALWILPGCDTGQSPAAEAANERAEELSRRLEAEHRQHARDVARMDAARSQAEEDFRSVATILVSSAIAMAILVLLLARERRARRILERLLRMILDRINGSRRPSNS
jgi:hypothetical protein